MTNRSNPDATGSVQPTPFDLSADCRSAAEHLPAVLEGMGEALAIIDREWRLCYLNGAAAVTFSRSAEELVGKRLGEELVPELSGTSLEARLRAAMSNGVPAQFENYFEPWDHWFETRAVPSGEHLLVFWCDITDRKQDEHHFQQLNETLEGRVAERTAELEHRASQLELMADELTHTEQRERRRLARLLHDDLQQILVAAKMRLSRVPAEIDDSVREAVAGATDLLKQAIDTSRSLSTELAPPVLYDLGFGPALKWLGRWAKEKYNLQVAVELDEAAEVENEKLRVVVFETVRELLLNVVKHGGVGEAQVGVQCQGDRMCVTVEDLGRGFETEEVGDRDEASGYGLLSIEQRLKLLGGEVVMESRPGEGTRVEIRVPMQSAAAEVETILAADRPPLEVNDPANSGPVRVLLTDDHEILRRGLANLIGDQPDMKVVGEAASGEEALEKARALRPEVAVMDISLPGISGIEATRQLKQELAEICVIGLSIHEERDVADALQSAGASAYCSKSQPSEELLAAIRQLVPNRSGTVEA